MRIDYIGYALAIISLIYAYYFYKKYKGQGASIFR
jgi:hypothetical protein